MHLESLQRLGDHLTHAVPVGSDRVAFELCPQLAGPLANAGRFGPQPIVTNHLLHVAEAIGPVLEIGTGDHARVARARKKRT